MLQKQLGRMARSAIIVTSSGLAGMSMPSVLCYSASKAAVSNFFHGLAYEVRDRMDVMVWEAGSIDTKMTAQITADYGT